jgi:hypothetical protein
MHYLVYIRYLHMTGSDRIPAKLLRCCAPYISSSLTDLFNKSLIPNSYLYFQLYQKSSSQPYTANWSTMPQVSCITFNMDFSGGSLQHHNYYRFYMSLVSHSTKESKLMSFISISLKRLTGLIISCFSRNLVILEFVETCWAGFKTI